jgi:hypothetical protein
MDEYEFPDLDMVEVRLSQLKAIIRSLEHGLSIGMGDADEIEDYKRQVIKLQLSR